MTPITPTSLQTRSGRQPKNIVLFMDGTWNQYDDTGPTNVHKLFERVSMQADPSQLVHYIHGVGTTRRNEAALPDWAARAGIPEEPDNVFARMIRRCRGGLFGHGMPAKVMEAYAFMVAHYEPGDFVYLFGFSRGAYAVRVLSCFIEEVGLLYKDQLEEVGKAYQAYESGDEEGMAALRAHNVRMTGAARPVRDDEVLRVHMMGVWDTVGAMKFTDTHVFFHPDKLLIDIPENITHVRHALALHELRQQFEPSYWRIALQNKGRQSLEQVWFAGAHSDVGGGYDDAGLSDIPLEWMAGEAKKLGLLVDAYPDRVADKTVDKPVHNSLTPAFAYWHPALREFLRESPCDFFNKDLAHFAVHQTACDRLIGEAMPEYRCLVHDINVRLREVDEATVNLVWALGLRFGQLPLSSSTSGASAVIANSIDAIDVTDTVPASLRAASAAGMGTPDSHGLIERGFQAGEAAGERFAMSVLLQAMLASDVALDVLTAQLQSDYEALWETAAWREAGPDEKAIARLVGAWVAGVVAAADMATNPKLKEMLVSLGTYLHLSYVLPAKNQKTPKRKI